MALQTANQFNLSPDIVGGVTRGMQAGQNIANQFRLAQMQAQEAPMRQQLLAQQVAAQEQAQQQALTEQQRQEQISNINAHARAANIIKPFIEKGDILGASTQLEQMAQLLPPNSVKFLEENLATGNLDAISNQIQSIETLQAQLNVPQTLEAQKLALRERELEQRKELIEGEAERAGEKEAAKVKAKAEAEAEKVDLIASTKSAIASAVETAKIQAKDKGETLTSLGQAKAALPGLNNVVDQLRELAPIATSTIGGKIFDTAVKELGFGSTKGADARAKFIAVVNNQVIPLLKPTFGGAFTFQEGEALKATMGDPDATPSQKLEQLDAFIANKVREIEAKEARLDQEQPKRIRFDAQGNIIQ